MTTYVLVHGAWHGGWQWRDVVPLIRAAGHEVTTPTLTGLGERRHLAGGQVDLSTHVADFVNHGKISVFLDGVGWRPRLLARRDLNPCLQTRRTRLQRHAAKTSTP